MLIILRFISSNISRLYSGFRSTSDFTLPTELHQLNQDVRKITMHYKTFKICFDLRNTNTTLRWNRKFCIDIGLIQNKLNKAKVILTFFCKHISARVDKVDILTFFSSWYLFLPWRFKTKTLLELFLDTHIFILLDTHVFILLDTHVFIWAYSLRFVLYNK